MKEKKEARMRDEEEDGYAEIERIPVELLAKAISLSTPPDACRAAAVSTAFRAAADSDAVWKRFLPPDCSAVLDRAVHPEDFSSNKELFLNISDEHILIDDGKISFGLDRWTGAKCYMLSSIDLGIAWIGTDIYWRFSKVAELVSVCWFNIHGCISCSALSAGTTYAAYLVFKLAPNANGLDSRRQRSLVEVGRRRVCLHAASLLPCNRASCAGAGVLPAATATAEAYYDIDEPHDHEDEDAGGGRVVVRYPRPRVDGWMEIEMSEFDIDHDTVGNVDMILQELEELHWKTGLIVEGLDIRPKKKKN